MKWSELRRMLTRKLKAIREDGTRHEIWKVFCGDKYVGRVLVTHGDGEMRGHEIGNVADSLNINEHELKELVRCTMSRDEFCARQ